MQWWRQDTTLIKAVIKLENHFNKKRLCSLKVHQGVWKNFITKFYANAKILKRINSLRNVFVWLKGVCVQKCKNQ
jgi:hypothetical protein